MAILNAGACESCFGKKEEEKEATESETTDCRERGKKEGKQKRERKAREEKSGEEEKKGGKEEREGDMVCVALMPGDTTTFEDGQKGRRRDEWRETRE